MKAKRAHLLFFALIAVITTIAYSNSFHCAFVFDDYANIVNIKSIRVFQPDISSIIEAATGGPNSKRWFPNLSFAFNYYLGGEDVWGYHLVNLIIHIGTTFALYFLFSFTLRQIPGEKKAPSPEEIAFFAALLWAVHPIQTNGVTYLVQRMTSMCTFFYCTSLLCYIHGRSTKQSYIRKILLYGTSFLSGFMAIASKENAIILPVMILGYEIFFLQTKQHSKSYQSNLLRFLAVLFFIGGLTVVFLGSDIFSTIMAGYDYRPFTMTERLLTQTRVIFYYIGLLLLPLPSRLNLNHDISLSYSLISPPTTLFAVLGIILLTGSIIFFFKRNRLFSFALFWFLGNLIIESSIVPLELIFEHRLYLPSIFLVLYLVCALYQLANSNTSLVRVILVVLISLGTIWTWQRNQVWVNNKTLWSDVVAKSPGLARGYNNLGVTLHEEGNLKEAEQLFLKAIQMEPESRVAYISLGSLYVTQNRLQEAEKVLRTALTKERAVNPSRIFHYLGVMYRKAGNCQQAMQYAERALHLEKNDSESLITIGICYEQNGEYEKADATFHKAFQSGLDYNIDLYNNWGIVANKMGQPDRAIRYFNKALELDPDHPESHYNLGLVYSAKGMMDKARDEMQKSMELRQKMQPQL